MKLVGHGRRKTRQRREAHRLLGRRDQRAGGERGIDARGRRHILHDPVAEMDAERGDGLALRHRILGEQALAVVGASRTYGRRFRVGGEAAVAAAVLRAADVIAAHIGGNGNVLVRRRADKGRRDLQAPELGRAEMFEDARAGVGRRAAVEDAGGRKSAQLVFGLRPGVRALVGRLVDLRDAVGRGEPVVQSDALAGDDRPSAVENLAALLVFVEALMEELADHVARLRLTARGRPLHRPASGFAVPVESAFSFLKNEATSRKAAKPMPSTGGSFAVKAT